MYKRQEYAVANSAARVCAAVLHNEHAVLSASTLMTGQYGEEGIFTSLPCVIGAEGVEEVYTLDLSEHELEGCLLYTSPRHPHQPSGLRHAVFRPELRRI